MRGNIGEAEGGPVADNEKKPHEAYNNEHIFTQIVLGE